LIAKTVPMIPPAPGRLSATIGWPREALSFGIIVLMIISGGPPGAVGKMTRIVLFG